MLVLLHQIKPKQIIWFISSKLMLYMDVLTTSIDFQFPIVCYYSVCFLCPIYVQAMYIRIKRHKTTYFIQCDPIETTLNIKQKLETLIDQPVVDQRLILVGSGEVLEDSKTLADQKVCLKFLYL